MFGFGKKKTNGSSNSRVVWRDAEGNIRCLGDNCAQKKCDDTCPIWLSTMAASLLAMNQSDKALPLLQKAASLAPDFYDAWNNMGAVFGQNGEYQKAHDAYKKAHECMPERSAPVFGLALSSRDLKLYDECIQWCDAYDELCDDGECDTIRAKAKAALNSAAR